jgi:hypothetical protein
MNRWSWFCACAVLGGMALAVGLLVPVHLRAVDGAALEAAGRGTPTLVDRGVSLVREGHAGAAQIILRAARTGLLPDRETLRSAVERTPQNIPAPSWLASNRALATNPITEVVVRLENRDRILEYLSASRCAAAKELLGIRASTNTVIFPPSQSASGQALDAAVSVTGLLLAGGKLTGSLSNNVTALAVQANRGGSSEALENALLDFMSLGQRMNWDQLAVFAQSIPDPDTLRSLAETARADDNEMPVLYSAVTLSGNPAAVARYVTTFSQSGMNDLAYSLRTGTGGLNELLWRNLRVHRSAAIERLSAMPVIGGFAQGAADFAWLHPRAAQAVQWFAYLAGGFLLALSVHFAWPPVSTLERPLQVRGFHVARETLFALGFLLVVLLLSEPFLAQESQKVDFHFRLSPPVVGGKVPTGTPAIKTTIMNPTNLLTLLLFFILQALLYTASLVKLAEIQRQRTSPRMKLKLLENEDHLFDAGLYLGFVGTIVSLILVSLGVIQFSLMAAYSSTSFGIVFVSVFKICNLRPVRRRLILESEGVPATDRDLPATAPALLTTP